jgi:D-alanyl-D-alanine carboxypeptidase
MTSLKLILLLLLFLTSELSYARYAAILIDADTGNVLHEVEATHSWYPASLTKVMTLYMTFSALNAGQVQLSDTIRVSQHASLQPQSKLGLRFGDSLTIREAILATITRSANDAAVALAEHLAGSEENFAVKMTAKAHALGMYDTHFMNATGLPHDWQVTTAQDMAVLAWKIRRHFPSYYPYFSAHSFNYKGRELRGINKFTANYPGAEGMKTGFTCGSGFNLIGSASQNGRRLIGVILGGMSSPERYQLMFKMMDAGFDNRFSAYLTRNVGTASANTAGIPPYQLSCGSRAPLHLPTHYSNGKSHSKTRKPISKTRKARSLSKSKRVGKTGHLSKNKRVSKSKPRLIHKRKNSKTRYRHSSRK